MQKLSLVSLVPKKGLLIIAFIFLMVVGGVYLTFFIATEQKGQEIYNWQKQLSLIADQRVTDVDHWIDEKFSHLENIAENTSIRLYLSELEYYTNNNGKAPDAPFQTQYIKNLITVTAHRAGFGGAHTSPTDAIKIPNRIQSSGGIAVLDKQRQIIVSTRKMPEIKGKLKKFMDSVVPAGSGISDIYMDSLGEKVVAFAVPIFAVQSDRDVKGQIGFVLGIRPVEDLFEHLKEKIIAEESLETLLVKVDYINNTIRYLSPRKFGNVADGLTIDASNQKLAAVFASAKEGTFAVKRDYMFNKVFVTGRKVNAVPWVLVTKVNRNEAFANVDARYHFYLFGGFLLITLILVVIVLVWRHAVSIKMHQAAEEYKMLADEFATQKRIIELVINHKPEAVYICDEDNKILLCNHAVAKQVGLKAGDIKNRTLNQVLNKEDAMFYIQANSSALLEKKIIAKVHDKIEDNGEKHIMQSKHIPIPSVPGDTSSESKQGVLIIEQDITDPINERGKFIDTLESLTSTLINILDRRDHHTADHSAKVAQLSEAVAAEMGLTKEEVTTARTAGRLMNLGKVFVPIDILTKSKRLSRSEEKLIHDNIKISSQLLEHINFEGPVIKTIEQSHKNLGHGSALSLKGKNILMTSRIISYVNAFVGMLSPRAYRDRIPLDEVLAILGQEAVHQDDKAVIAALVNYLENKGGRKDWEK